MMERRILKDFQIGIVETLVSEAVQGTKEAKDVFSSIAKAIGKKASTKVYVRAAIIGSIDEKLRLIVRKRTEKIDFSSYF